MPRLGGDRILGGLASVVRFVASVILLLAVVVTPTAAQTSPSTQVTQSGLNLVTSVKVGAAPTGVAVNSSTNRVYVANGLSGTLSVVDGVTNVVAATVHLGVAPAGVAVNSSSGRVYVANTGSN